MSGNSSDEMRMSCCYRVHARANDMVIVGITNSHCDSVKALRFDLAQMHYGYIREWLGLVHEDNMVQEVIDQQKTVKNAFMLVLVNKIKEKCPTMYLEADGHGLKIGSSSAKPMTLPEVIKNELFTALCKQSYAESYLSYH